MNVLVNFIISNAWLKQIGAVVDYEAHTLCPSPLYEVFKMFDMPITSLHRKGVTDVDGGSIVSHRASFKALPNMIGLLKAVTAFDK